MSSSAERSIHHLPLRLDRRVERLHRNAAVAAHAENAFFRAFVRGLVNRAKYGFVLDRAGDDRGRPSRASRATRRGRQGCRPPYLRM